jgi:hypothetical protein
VLGNGGLQRKLIWVSALAVAGLLGVLLPVAFASTATTVTAKPSGSALRATAADDTTDADTTTTDDEGTTVAISGNVPPAVVGARGDINYTTGTVLVKLPGSSAFVDVSTLSQQLPIGSVVDATKGLIQATFALPSGTTQTATFWNGEFTVTQTSTGAVGSALTGASFTGCPAPKKKPKKSSKQRKSNVASAAKAKTTKKPGTKVRSLWANATGSFKTTGKSGAAAVLGTEWLTIDQCDGTFFYVKKASNDPNGEIRVTVFFPRRHTVLLKRGHFLLAPARGYQK